MKFTTIKSQDEMDSYLIELEKVEKAKRRTLFKEIERLKREYIKSQGKPNVGTRTAQAADAEDMSGTLPGDGMAPPVV